MIDQAIINFRKFHGVVLAPNFLDRIFSLLVLLIIAGFGLALWPSFAQASVRCPDLVFHGTAEARILPYKLLVDEDAGLCVVYTDKEAADDGVLIDRKGATIAATIGADLKVKVDTNEVLDGTIVPVAISSCYGQGCIWNSEKNYVQCNVAFGDCFGNFSFKDERGSIIRVHFTLKDKAYALRDVIVSGGRFGSLTDDIISFATGFDEYKRIGSGIWSYRPKGSASADDGPDTIRVTHDDDSKLKFESTGTVKRTYEVDFGTFNTMKYNPAKGTSTSVVVNWESEKGHDFSQELAAKFAPILKFDRAAAAYGYPQQVQPLFDKTKSGEWPVKDGKRLAFQNVDRDTLKKATIPTYYQTRWIGNQIRIQYWWFYGYQEPCMNEKGAHHGDWENIIVTLNEDANSVAAVSYYQHGGHYTRIAGPRAAPCTSVGRCDGAAGFESEGAHPVVYVGKIAHGSFHDRKSSRVGLAVTASAAAISTAVLATAIVPAVQLYAYGAGAVAITGVSVTAAGKMPYTGNDPAGCLYYEDYRNPAGDVDYLRTWTSSLVDLDSNSEPWMFSDLTEHFRWGPTDVQGGELPGLDNSIATRPTRNPPMAEMRACTGNSMIPFEDAGCYQSECLAGDDQMVGQCIEECKSGFSNMGLTCHKWLPPHSYGRNYYNYDYVLPSTDVGLTVRRKQKTDWKR